MLKSLDLDSLKDKRNFRRLNVFYSPVNSLIPLPTPEYFLSKQCITRSYSSHSFIQVSCNHDYYLHSFFSTNYKRLELFAIQYSIQYRVLII